MTVPGYHPEWIVCVRGNNGKLYGFICGVPVTLRIREKIQPFSEINYLCVHKQIWAKWLAPILIKEVTWRINLKNIFVAVYTSGTLIPTPFAKCWYWHRNINVKKLIECKFSYLPQGRTMSLHLKLNKVADEPTIPNIWPMVKKDVSKVKKVLKTHLDKM